MEYLTKRNIKRNIMTFGLSDRSQEPEIKHKQKNINKKLS